MNNLTLLLIAAGSIFFGSADRLLAATKPNIVLIMADDMGFSDTSPFGGEINTPNIAQLAGDGVRFTNFYNTARCSTTRASLLTGQYSHNVGIGALPSTDYNSQNGGTMPGYSGWFAGTDPQAPEIAPTLPEIMKSGGYDTSMSGKWHLTRTNTINGGPNGTWPTDRGFDKFYGTMEGAKDYFEPTWLVDSEAPGTFVDTSALPSDYFYTNAISARGAQFIRDEYADGDDNPFFHYHAFYAPHFPLQAPADAEDAQGNNLIQKYQAIYSQGWDQLRDNRLANQIAQGLFAPGTPLSNKASSDSGIPDWDTLSGSQKDELILRMAIYASQVEILDQGVGKLIDAVRDPLGNGTGPGNDDDNLMNETLFVFLSDNGAVSGGGFTGTGDLDNWFQAGSATNVRYGNAWANLSNTPFRKFKTDTYEGGVATPLIVSGYGVNASLAGSVDTTSIGHVIDLTPTFMELGGVAYPADADPSDLEGQSLVGALDGSGADFSQRDIFFEHEGNRGVRSGKWKLVAPNGSNQYQLYDLSADRAESNDISAANPEIERSLRLKWEAWAIRNKVATPAQDNAGSPFLSNSEIDWLTPTPPPSPQPEVLGLYTFQSDLDSSDTAAGSVASPFSLGSGVIHSTSSFTIYADGNQSQNQSLAAAEANGFIAEFTISSASGVNLGNLTYTARFNNLDAGDSGALVLRSSIDGFATDIEVVSFAPVSGDNVTVDIPVDVDLSSYTGVTGMTFRFYFLGANNATNERTRLVGPVTLFAAPGLPGDFNNDGVVDIADYTVWRDNYGADEGDGVLSGNGNGGFVDTSDYLLWREAFGNTQAPANGSSHASVPEPTAGLILAIGASLAPRRLATSFGQKEESPTTKSPK